MFTLIKKPQEVAKDHFHLSFTASEQMSVPGQFINIKTSQSSDPLIRRPFSIYNHTEDVIEIIVRVIGKGTELIRYFSEGKVDVLGPLGNGFTIIPKGRALLVGGGVGNAPLYYLAHSLKRNGVHVTYLYGARSVDYVYCREAFTSLCDSLDCITDDGTSEHKGYVTDYAANLLSENSFDFIYTCGPTIMMEKLVKTVQLNEQITPIEVSLENYFGCGIGLCVGCSVETKFGKKRACLDGPVLDGTIIDFSTLE